MISLFGNQTRLLANEFRNVHAIKRIFDRFGAGLLQKRNLNVQEHVSYKLLNDAGIATPRFGVAYSAEEAGKIAKDLDTNNMVLKAQVLAGGRGVGRFKNGLKGGVRAVSTPEEAEELAGKMIGQILVTKQTGEKGRICNSVMVAERKFPRREFYFSIMMEGKFNGPVLIASSQGGVDIEEVAAENPDAIIYQPIDVEYGLQAEDALKVIEKVGLSGIADEMTKMLQKMYCLFKEKDALLIEINPFAEDSIEECEFFALDAKFRFDDNAEFRQKELFALRDWSQEDPKEFAAHKHSLNYIALDGNIGCMVNGAGLAMATMDIIQLYGGKPANFLDVGGSSSKKTITEAFKIITSDKNVECVFVNIFGGIVRCDDIAGGIIEAAQKLKVKIPIVCRLQGTNVVDARELILKSGLKIIPRDDFDEAAHLVVKMAEIVRIANSAKLEVSFQQPDKSAGGKSYKDPCQRAKELEDSCPAN